MTSHVFVTRGSLIFLAGVLALIGSSSGVGAQAFLHQATPSVDAGTNLGVFTPADSMNEARLGHISALLPDGKVLIAAGRQIPPSTSLASAEVYNPAPDTFSPTGSLATSRSESAGTSLPNGTVLVAGGHTGAFDPF